ncbi:MAG: class I SAM-dependent methyltransferase [Planctomycetales bacterium]|nr:class I SAM-dependent methyltransferase [Planctomycetales bacterium]
MNLRTLVRLAWDGRLRVMVRLARELRSYYRVLWVASAARSGILRRLSAGPVAFEELAAAFAPDPAARDGLASWLRLGVALRELRGGARGYRLRGLLARRSVDAAHDAAAALLEEAARLHHPLVLEEPARARENRPWALADYDHPLVARSSRLLEPFVAEALEAAVPREGAVRLLEVGCGSGVYVRLACERNPRLSALAVELDPAVASAARENSRAWGIETRVVVEAGDIRARPPDPSYDLATLHNNVYYFPVAERGTLLRHLRGFLRPGGALLVTTACRGGSFGLEVLDLWASTTAGAGRLPDRDELLAQLREAGFSDPRARSLIWGDRYYAFSARA